MVSRIFLDALLAVYHGEHLGEAVFETMLPTAESDEQRYMLGSLLQLESEGKMVMRPLLMKFGLPLDENPESRSNGVAGAGGLMEMSWREKFAAMAASIEVRGLPQYEELATLISADEDAEAYRLAEFMGAHERAILAASENIAAGHPDPVAPVVEILHFPLIKPHQ